MLGAGGRQTKPDRKNNRLCLCPAPVAPPHILISLYLCLREEVIVGRPRSTLGQRGSKCELGHRKAKQFSRGHTAGLGGVESPP